MAKRTIANLNIQLGAHTASLRKGFDSAAGSVRGFRTRVSSVGSAVGGVFIKLGVMAAKFAAAMAVSVAAAGAAFAGWSIKLAAEAEQSKVAFEVLLGSASEAAIKLQELREFGAATPFQFADLQDNAKTLLAFGTASDKLLPTLKMLGDVAAGDQQKLNQLALVYGQISSAGRLMGGDLLQLINVGFNPLQKMAERTGRSMLDLKKDMENGLISFEMVEAEFRAATEAGGMFFGMTERMGNTLAGRWSTLKDKVAMVATEYGTRLIPILKDVMNQLDAFLKSINLIGEDGQVNAEKMTTAFEVTRDTIARLIKTSQGLTVTWFEAQSAAAEILAITSELYALYLKIQSLNPAIKAFYEWKGLEVEKEIELYREIAKSVREVAVERGRMAREAAEGDWAGNFLDRIKQNSDAEAAGIAAIGEQTAAQAEAATEQLEAVVEQVKRLKPSGGVAAVDVRTTAGFSALQAGASLAREQTMIARNQLAESRRQTQLLADIRNASQRGGAVTVVQNRI